MDLLVACGAGLSGYLLGGISFARIVVRVKTGGAVAPIELVTPDGQGHLRADAISASAVRLQLGPRYGILVGVLDVLKAFAPTLVWRLALPDQPYFLICAAATVFGHSWPVYYRFRGGNGQSVILGGMLAIDSVGALVTNGIALGLGMTGLRDGLIGDIGGIPLLIPWLWWRTDGDPAYLAYAVAVSIAFWVSFRGTVSGYPALKRAGHLPTTEFAVRMSQMDFPIMRSLSRTRYVEIDALSRGAGGASQPAAGAVDDQLPGVAS